MDLVTIGIFAALVLLSLPRFDKAVRKTLGTIKKPQIAWGTIIVSSFLALVIEFLMALAIGAFLNALIDILL